MTAGQPFQVLYALAPCSLGVAIVAGEGGKLCALWFGDDAEALVKSLRKRFPQAQPAGHDAAMKALVAKAVNAIEAPHLPWRDPLALRGTAFQQRVWAALRDIPAGETASYAQVAARIGAATSMRAVAGACAANPIAVIVPCHRVIRSDGALSGYAGGVHRKRELLAREAAARAKAA